MNIQITLFGNPPPSRDQMLGAENAIREIVDSFGVGSEFIVKVGVVHVRPSIVTDKNGDSQVLVAFINLDVLTIPPGQGHLGHAREDANILNQVPLALEKALARKVVANISLY